MTAPHFLLASPALRRIEHDAASTLPPGTLMDRAARSAAARVAASWPGGPVVVLCGPGNNGGDGFVLARLLHEAGRDVRVWALPAPPGGRPADAQRAWEALPPGLVQSGEPVWRAPRGEAVGSLLGDAASDGDAHVDGGDGGVDADAGREANPELGSGVDVDAGREADLELDSGVDVDAGDAVDTAAADAASADLVSTHALFDAPLLDQGRITTGLLLDDEAPGGVIVDALFGIGLTRPLDPQARAWVEWANAQPVARLAIDVPSGLNADTGAAQEICLLATRTLTFIADKPGLHTRAGADVAGEVEVDALSLPGPFAEASVADGSVAGNAAGTGLAPAAPASGAASAADATAPASTADAPATPTTNASTDTGRLISRADCNALFQPRRHDTHKGSFGTLAVLAGAPGMTGAALLASRAALLTGAGKVFVALAEMPPLSLPCDPLHPELMVRDAQSMIAAARDLGVTTWVAGCGLGAADDARAWLVKVLEDQPDAAVVLDADALTLLASHGALQQALARRTGTRVLTPHPLEAARLLDRDTHAVQADRVASARDMAARYQAWVVLKGAGTVVSSPDGAWSINGSGNAGLATAGTGDVLSGMLGALLAQGLDPEDAIRGGVWLHGAAADHLVAQGCGPIGLSASEVATAARHVRNGG